MPTCPNGHYSAVDGKFCVSCGAAYSVADAATSGVITPPSGGFRSTMKSAPSASTYNPAPSGYSPSYSSSAGYSPAAPPMPTYSGPMYATPSYSPGTRTGETVKGMSIAGMVLGIVGIVFFFVPIIGIVCAIIGLVLSSVAWRKISTGEASPDGKGFAITGFVTSLISVAFALYILLVVSTLFV